MKEQSIKSETKKSFTQIGERLSQSHLRILTSLLDEAALIISNQDYHIMTSSNFGKFISKKLNGNERKIWTKYGAQIGRDRARLKKNESIEKKRVDRIELNLVGLEPEELLKKIIRINFPQPYGWGFSLFKS